jgi:hypothetical protein
MCIALCIALAAGCSGAASPQAAGQPGAPRTAARTAAPMTELERRQQAACRAVGERTTTCAVADARAKATPAELRELALDETAPRNTAKFVDKCLAQPMSSRQVRVFEVCHREERECEPFFACLEHAKPVAPR